MKKDNEVYTRGICADMIEIDGEKFKDALAKEGFAAINISVMIAHRDKSYLSNCCKKNKIERKAYEDICTFFALDKEEFLSKDTQVVVDEKGVTNSPSVTVDMSGIEKKLDTLISAVEMLSKGMDAIVSLQAQTQKRIMLIEQGVTIVGKNTAATVEELKVDLDSIDDGIGKVNSNLNIIKGMMRDEASNSPSIKAVK